MESQTYPKLSLVVGIKIRAKSMFQTGRRERVPSHLFLIVFDAILLANHVTITSKRDEG